MKKEEKPPTKGYIFPNKKVPRDQSIGRSLGRAGVIGLHPVSGLVVGGVLGYYLWKEFDVAWIFWGLTAAGFIAGCRNAYRDARAMLREEEADDAAKKTPRH